MPSKDGTHYYGDACVPEHKASEPCDKFTSDSHIHAHELGRVPCVNCGWRFQEHKYVAAASPPVPFSIKQSGFVTVTTQVPAWGWKCEKCGWIGVGRCGGTSG